MTDTPEPESPVVSGEIVSKAYDGPGEWLPVALAGVRIDVSERTMRRYVDAGLYQRRHVKGRLEVYVPLSGAVPDTEEIGENAEEKRGNALAVSGADPDTLALAIIQELREQRTSDRESLTRQAEEIGSLRARLAAAEADLAAERARRPWWKRLLG